jgi:hypothetical protein
MIMPTRSSPEVHEYNPWIDYDDDGIISYSDLFYFGKAWYTTGDPTKNVNVKDSIFTWCPGIVYIAPSSSWSCRNSTIGYRQVTIRIFSNTTLFVDVEAILTTYDPFGSESPSCIERFTYYEGYGILTKTYDVLGTSIEVVFYNWSNSTSWLFFQVYMNSIPSLNSRQNVNVTNWPEPYRIVDLEYNVSWSPPYYTATLYTGNVYVGDYSRFYVYAVPDLEKNVGELGSTYETNISLSAVEYNLDVHAIWDASEGFVPPLYITTFQRYANGQVGYEPLPKVLPEFKVQAPFISVCLSLKSTSDSGWVVLRIRIFMRNE